MTYQDTQKAFVSYHERLDNFLNEKGCDRCGCNIPKTEFFETGCSYCETKKETYARSLTQFHKLLDKKTEEREAKA